MNQIKTERSFAFEEQTEKLMDILYHLNLPSEVDYKLVDLFKESWKLAEAEGKEKAIQNVDLICSRARDLGMVGGA